MLVDAQTLRDTVGNIASGPAGFDVRHEIKADAEINPGSNTVPVEVNEQSLAQAHARNDGGINKPFAAQHGPGVGSKALNAVVARQDKAFGQYANMLQKRGLDKVLQPKQAPHPQAASRGPYKEMSGTGAKNILQNIQKRNFLTTRQHLDQIQRVKTQPITIDNASQTLKDKVVETALQKGETNTPLGAVSKLAAHMPASKIYSSFRRWQHALMDGSFIDMPHVKGS